MNYLTLKTNFSRTLIRLACNCAMPVTFGPYGAPMMRRAAMSESVPAIKRIVANTINEPARGDPVASPVAGNRDAALGPTARVKRHAEVR